MDPPSAEGASIAAATLIDKLCTSAGRQFKPCWAVFDVMAGSTLGTVLYPSSERSLLVSESSEWKGSAGETPSVG
jgi:hypothetical protein